MLQGAGSYCMRIARNTRHHGAISSGKGTMGRRNCDPPALPQSPYNIGYIIAEKPKKDGGRARPLETVIPLAADLELTVDISVGREHIKEVRNLTSKWLGPRNILICWEHKRLSDIAAKIGAKEYGDDVPKAVRKAGTDDGDVAYPSDRFDLIWTLEYPYREIKSVASQNCPGLDDGHKDP